MPEWQFGASANMIGACRCLPTSTNWMPTALRRLLIEQDRELI